MTLRDRVARLERQAAGAGGRKGCAAQLWLPRKGLVEGQVPYPEPDVGTVEEQLARGERIIFYEPGQGTQPPYHGPPWDMGGPTARPGGRAVLSRS